MPPSAAHLNSPALRSATGGTDRAAQERRHVLVEAERHSVSARCILVLWCGRLLTAARCSGLRRRLALAVLLLPPPIALATVVALTTTVPLAALATTTFTLAAAALLAALTTALPWLLATRLRRCCGWCFPALAVFTVAARPARRPVAVTIGRTGSRCVALGSDRNFSLTRLRLGRAVAVRPIPLAATIGATRSTPLGAATARSAGRTAVLAATIRARATPSAAATLHAVGHRLASGASPSHFGSSSISLPIALMALMSSGVTM